MTPRTSPRARASLAALGAGALLAALPAASADAGYQRTRNGCKKTTLRDRGAIKARFFARGGGGHTPNRWRYAFDKDAGRRAWVAEWPIKVIASHRGRRIGSGKVWYQFIFSGRTVACRTPLPPSRLRGGVLRDTIQWPERAVGIPFVFRVVLITRYGVKNLDYRVKVAPRRR